MTCLRHEQCFGPVWDCAVVVAGSLVLGQNQECYGACFSPSQSLDGSMAAVRVWDRVRSQASHLCCISLSCRFMSAPCP